MRVIGQIAALAGIALLFHVLVGWVGWFVVGGVLIMLLIDKLFSLPGAARRRRRLAEGHCPECDYDLHGVMSDRCPECGEKRAMAPTMPRDE